jgi:hypothetical protein
MQGRHFKSQVAFENNLNTIGLQEFLCHYPLPKQMLNGYQDRFPLYDVHLR